MKISVKKQLATLMLSVILAVLLFPATALADVIAPDEALVSYPRDAFLQSHFDDCSDVFQRFITDGEDGQVTIYQDPVSSITMASIENGTSIMIACSYPDGETLWGVASDILVPGETSEYDKVYTGWVKMSEMSSGDDGVHENSFSANESPILAILMVIIIVIVVVVLLLIFWRKKLTPKE